MKGLIAVIAENRAMLLIGQIIVLLICVGYVDYFYYKNIYPDKRAKEMFQQTTCTLLNKKLNIQQDQTDELRYRADFLVSYVVAGTQYKRWVSGNGLNTIFTERRVPKEEVLSRFTVGGTYACWYDPDNPSVAILVMRHYWFSTFPLIFPALIGVITFYFFLTNILDLLGDAIVRFREKNNDKK